MLPRILVFEFVTGGGLAQEELPDSLAEEGGLMLQTLVEQLASLSHFQIIVLLDWRCNQFEFPENIEIVLVNKNQSVYDLLPELMNTVNYVWPIAPEMDGVLHNITLLVEESGAGLLNSLSTAVALCSDKLITFQKLKQQGVAVVETLQLDMYSDEFSVLSVIKPKHGVGCLDSFLISNQNELKQIKKQIKQNADYVIQPYIKGESLSLSCLFKKGKAWLLCCNQQQVSVSRGQFQLRACIVNYHLNDLAVYQQLINQVAKIIPGLWGYVGIDFILSTQQQPLILEINPRLTTSYVGINQALGMNVANMIIEMLDGDPVIKKSRNQSVTLTLKKD